MNFVRNKKIFAFMLVILTIMFSISNFYRTPKIYAYSLPSLVYIDAPQNNSTTNQNQINVVGWSLDPSGVSKVQIYVDNVYKGDANIGISRPDVNRVFPGYTGGTTSGYSYALNLSGSSNGKHTITVKSIGKNGIITQESVNLNYTILSPLMWIDTPQNNANVNQNQISVNGWSLDSNGIDKVQVYLDDVYKGDANTGISRTDVNRVFPGYSEGANSGYNYVLSLSNIQNGIHTVTVKSIGKSGKSIQKNVQINKIPLSSLECIDTPSNNSTIKNQKSINISGWSLDSSGIDKVQVYLDNAYKGDASVGVLRPDVNKVFPSYVSGANSGYSYTLNLLDVSDGNHTVSVKSLGKSGTVIQKDITIDKLTSPSLMCIDAPSAYSFIKGNQFNVSGWSLNAYGVKNVQVYVDGVYKGDAAIGGARPDVNNVYPGYIEGSNSGFNYALDMSSFATGVHTITVKSVGNDGGVIEKNTQVYKLSNDGQALSPLICMDTPTNNMFVKNGNSTMNISGWSLDAFGVNQVQVYIDGVYKGNATTGGARPDVNNVYPGYTGGSNSGFNYAFNLSSISDGVHTITVESIGNDGFAVQQSTRIYKFSSSNQFITSYNLSLSNMVNTQMNYGQPVMESGNNWVNADSNTVQYYVDPMNFMDSYGVYQFLRLDYMQGVTADDLNKILAGKGVLDGKGAQFLAAAQQSNVNPIYLVSHALLETGNGYSKLATGINVNGQTVYNLFGIGAYDSNANYYGSVYAYNKGWFSIDQAIYGGAQWISGDFINNSQYGQNTLYKMRWNPASPGNHQYATDVRWAYNQVYNIKKLTDMVGNPVLKFDIPQYK